MRNTRGSLRLGATLFALSAGLGMVQYAAAAAPPAEAPVVTRQLAPAGAPNIVVVLLDDVGFGAAGTFGGPVETPALDALAHDGLRYNRFHTTAICSPTRAALLTGRNSHAAGVGSVMNTATSYPGYRGVLREDTATIARILGQNGYATSAWGKWHLVPDWEASQTGPFTRWPTGAGFDKFYGFLGGETDQYEPTLYDGTTPVVRERAPGYHLTEDMAEQAVAWMQMQRAVDPARPFFVYFAPGAAHAPLQPPAAWLERYRGKFDQGWDRLREETFARQQAAGVIPRDAVLTPRPDALPAWDSLTPEEQRVSARLMELYAAFLAHTDAQVGRLRDALKDMDQYDNTLFVYIVGDNGASAEGGLKGSSNYMGDLQGLVSEVARFGDAPQTLSGENTYAHYNSGWAWGTNTPFQWTKQVASHFGGTRNGMVMRWPGGIRAKGEIRSQFHHVVDVAPTALEAAKLPQPKSVNGVAQRPMDGVSMLYSADAPKAADRRTTQYFEMFGNRAIYHEGWVAATRHSIPWLMVPLPAVKDDVWELYHVEKDFSQANDLAAKEPAKLAELQAIFLKEAVRNHVLPIDDRRSERFNPAIAGRPDLLGGRKSLTVYPGMTGMLENAFINVKGVHHTVTAEVELADASTDGVILAQAGYFGGWVLYMKDGKPHHEYNFFALERTNIAGETALAPGKHTIHYEFIPDTAKPGTGGKSILTVDGQQVASGQIPKTQPFVFSADEGADVGLDGETNVSPDYTQGNNAFTGKIVKVTVEQK